MPEVAQDIAAGLAVAAVLGLEPLAQEGGLFRRTYTGPHCTAIYFMVIGDDFSAMHRMVSSDELFLFHSGAPLRMLVLDGPTPTEVLLGPDPAAGHSPAVLVPAGIWQGASSSGSWSLVSTVVSPGFEWSDFQLGNRHGLQADFPAAADRIAALTRGRDVPASPAQAGVEVS